MSEFTAADFEGKSPEELATLVNEKVGGLVANRDSFRSEKEAATAKASEASQAAEAARQELVSKEQELLKAQGDMDGYRQSVEAEFAKREAVQKELTEKAQNALISRDKTEVMSELMQMAHSDMGYHAKLMFSNALEIGYNDDNVATHTFKHNGEVVADSIESFKGWAAENSEYKKVLKGVDSGGAGVTQSSGTTGVSGSVQSRLSQRLRAKGVN